MNAFAPDPDDATPAGDGETDPVCPDLREVFELTRPAEPSGATWNRVQAAVSAGVARRSATGRWVGWAVAAGVLLAVGAAAWWSGAGNPVPDVAGDDGPDAAAEFAVLPVANDEDVDVHRVRLGGWALAVGTSPIPEKITWAGKGDVRVASSVPDDFGSEPKMGTTGPPVIWADDSPVDKND